MKIAVCYIAVTHGKLTDDFASRFVVTYKEYDAEAEHDLFICCNGGPLSGLLSAIFSYVKPKFYPRENTKGFDIDTYIDMATGPAKDYDMLVCLGESVYFHRHGWLKRLKDAWEKHGEGIYGPFSSHLVRAHLNTTAFCSSPALIADFAKLFWKYNDGAGRYDFEHGKGAFWRWVHYTVGKPAMLVTWDGEWKPGEWRLPKNILWRGDQSNCLMWCNHTDAWRDGTNEARRFWSSGADRQFE